MTSKIDWHLNLGIIYFSILVCHFMAELFSLNEFSFGCRLAGPITLALLYFFSSKKNELTFYLFLTLYVVSNVLFNFRDSFHSFLAVYTFLLLRIFALYIIIVKTKNINALHILTTSFVFLILFFYLASVTDQVSDHELDTLIIQSILISALTGISVMNYFNEENLAHAWLLISTLFFIGLRFIVFIEQFLVESLAHSYSRPISVILSGIAFFAFYKYIITSELEESNIKI